MQSSKNATLYKTSIEFHHVAAGFSGLLPICFFVAVFGAAFGLAASESGIGQSATLLMSAWVFAGAAQFGVLDLWGSKISVLPLVITVFAINARHLLFSASLFPYLSPLKPMQRYGILFFVSDANWALSMRQFTQNKVNEGVGILFGGGLALWVFWMLGTGVGLYFGNYIGDPQVYGLDMVMACFLLTMVIEGRDNMFTLNSTVMIWLTAGVSSILAFIYLPENMHIIVGALLGGLVGLFINDANILNKDIENAD